MSPVPASAIAIDDNPTNALTRRLRVHLQALAALRVPITYRDVAKAIGGLIRGSKIQTVLENVFCAFNSRENFATEPEFATLR